MRLSLEKKKKKKKKKKQRQIQLGPRTICGFDYRGGEDSLTHRRSSTSERESQIRLWLKESSHTLRRLVVSTSCATFLCSCWITATVLQDILIQNSEESISTTLTEMCIHFLLIQMNMKNQKYDDQEERESTKNLDSLSVSHVRRNVRVTD